MPSTFLTLIIVVHFLKKKNQNFTYKLQYIILILLMLVVLIKSLRAAACGLQPSNIVSTYYYRLVERDDCIVNATFDYMRYKYSFI